MGLALGFAGAKQCLGKHAAPVRALAPDRLSLDHRQLQSAVLMPAAIASPATSRPRHTTSNACVNSVPP